MKNHYSKFIFLMLLFFFISTGGKSQNEIERIEPPNWWVGMEHNEIQLLIYGENIAASAVSIIDDEVSITGQKRVENPNYLFLDIRIPEDKEAGDFIFQFEREGKEKKLFNYTLLPRNEFSGKRKIDGSDVMYLITPDRFANGDPGNDEVDGMIEGLDRTSDRGRHGGDLKGISENLAYFKELGITSLWLNPIIENNMPKYSYHGYASTDFYRVDPRYGSNEEYKVLCEKSSREGIGIVMDMIMNHCGSEHWFVLDPPMSNWINMKGEFKGTSHKRVTLQDIHASEYDKKAFSDGWFVKTMPDMNQRNPFMAKYLIQNTIWWIEYSGISGIRMDTYSYPDKDFMSDWTCSIEKEYPGFFIVGEEWSLNPAIVSYWQKGKVNHDAYTSCLPSLMDFPLQYMLVEALNEKENWNKGWIKAYEMLANDFLYPEPKKLVIFPDNHDMARFYTQVENDLDLFKMGMVYFLTMRGIPQIYYGTEILMNSDENPGDHGLIRSDFPGGWEGDEVNGFTAKGLTEKQSEAFDFVKKLLNWRKDNNLIHTGDLMQFTPYFGVYSFIRYTKEGRVLVIFNKKTEEQIVNMDRYDEMLSGYDKAHDVLNDRYFQMEDQLVLQPRSVLILELKE